MSSIEFENNSEGTVHLVEHAILYILNATIYV